MQKYSSSTKKVILSENSDFIESFYIKYNGLYMKQFLYWWEISLTEWNQSPKVSESFQF